MGKRNDGTLNDSSKRTTIFSALIGVLRVSATACTFLVAANALSATTPAAPLNNASAFLTFGTPISTPHGAANLCERYRWACQSSGRVRFAPAEALSIAVSVNRRVNSGFRQISDSTQYRQEDRWALLTNRGGDCEDFALQKMLELIERGVPPEALMIATVHSRSVGAHAVLVLRTERGDFVLDNLNRRVLHWSETTYAFLRVQDPASRGRWLSAFRNVPRGFSGA